MSLVDSLADFIRRIGAPQFVGVVIVLLAGLAGLWGLVAWGSAPEYVPIVQNVSIETIAAAERAIQDAGLEARLSPSGGAVLVREQDAARARVALAEQGVASADHRGFELFDEPAWGMTDFTQRINYRRALEGELERSIGQMRGITSAEVHLAMREGSVYRRQDRPVEASVLLSVASGARPTGEQVEAIAFLLASAVEGLTTEGVSVLDDAGRVLSAATEPNSSSRMDRRRLDMQVSVEDYLERRATDLLDPLLGSANVQVSVSAQLDLQSVERRTDSVDPNQQVLTAEERSEIEPGDPTQGAASTIQHNTFDVTRSTELLTQSPGAISRLTIAVAINEDVPRANDPALVGRIQELVGNAVGFDSDRGDAISVLAVPFETVPIPALPTTGPTTSPLDLLREFQRPIMLVFALILTFVLILRGLSFARAALPEAAPALPAGAYGSPAVRSGGEGAASPGLGEGTLSVPGAQSADAARVVRAWLGEE